MTDFDRCVELVEEEYFVINPFDFTKEDIEEVKEIIARMMEEYPSFDEERKRAFLELVEMVRRWKHEEG